MTTDPLDLSFFVQLTRHSSLAAAARAMNISAPAVSRRLAQLEQRLGVRLLNRTTRRQSLTAEGERFLQEGGRILKELEQLEHDLTATRDTPSGTLRINAGFGFGRRHMAPVISQFQRRYPQVDVLLHLTDRPLDLAQNGMDMGIRFGIEADSALIARKIAANRRILCAAPSYLADRPAPSIPADLAGHACITLRENDQPFDIWPLLSAAERQDVRIGGPLSTNHGEVAMDWAVRGHGILLRSQWDVAPYIRSGDLVQVLPDWSGVAADIYAVYLQRHLLSAKVRVFLDFLADHFAAHRATPESW